MGLQVNREQALQISVSSPSHSRCQSNGCTFPELEIHVNFIQPHFKNDTLPSPWGGGEDYTVYINILLQELFRLLKLLIFFS